MDKYCTDDHLQQLGRRENLEGLALWWCLKPQTINTVFTPDAMAFQSLKFLKVGIRSCDVSKLVEGIRETPIRDLRLSVRDNLEVVLRHLAVLHNLQTLDVAYKFETRHSLTDLQALQSLNQLRTLVLGRCEYAFVEPDTHYGDITDDTFDKFISHFPHLFQLNLILYIDVSVSALRSIAKHCPHIQEIGLYPTHPCDLNGFEELPAPAFRVLDSLVIDRIEGGTREQ